MTCGSPKHRREELLRLARENKEHDISVEKVDNSDLHRKCYHSAVQRELREMNLPDMP